MNDSTEFSIIDNLGDLPVEPVSDNFPEVECCCCEDTGWVSGTALRLLGIKNILMARPVPCTRKGCNPGFLDSEVIDPRITRQHCDRAHDIIRQQWNEAMANKGKQTANAEALARAVKTYASRNAI